MSQILNETGLSEVWESVLLASSQVRLILLVQGPPFHSHWPKGMNGVMNKGRKA